MALPAVGYGWETEQGPVSESSGQWLGLVRASGQKDQGGCQSSKEVRPSVASPASPCATRVHDSALPKSTWVLPVGLVFPGCTWRSHVAGFYWGSLPAAPRGPFGQVATYLHYVLIDVLGVPVHQVNLLEVNVLHDLGLEVIVVFCHHGAKLGVRAAGLRSGDPGEETEAVSPGWCPWGVQAPPSLSRQLCHIT